MKAIYLIIAVLLAVSISCKTKKTTVNNIKTATTTFTKLLAESHSNIQKKDFLIIKDDKALNTIFAKINSTRMPGVPIPKINFDEEMVLGLFMGSKTSGGYTIKIDHIEQNPNEMIVFYSEQHPTGMATSVMTQPCYLAKIAKTDKTIRFELIKN